jgi:uncharacterized membrane protein YbhN (UPF0104 family)
VLCFASQVAFYAAVVFMARALGEAEGGPRIGVWLTAKISFAALGATRLFAAAGAGGLAVIYWAYRQAGLGRRAALVRVPSLNVLLYAAFGAAALISALLLLAGLPGNAPLTMTLPWASGVGLCMAVGYWVTRPVRAERLIGAERGKVRLALGQAVEATMLVLRLANDGRANRATLLAAPAYWLSDMFCLYAGLRAFEVRISILVLVIVYATGFLANMLPLPTGGIGGVDAATTFALTAVGVPLSSALLGVFAYRFFSFLLPTLPAVLALPTLQRLSRELQEVGSHA